MTDITRRRLLAAAGASACSLILGGCASQSRISRQADGATRAAVQPAAAETSGIYGAVLDGPFRIPAVNLRKLEPRFRRQLVDDPTGERPGTVVVDTANRYLYHVQTGGMAMRYGVGIGRAGFAWSGRAIIAYKRKWPRWTPPAEMIARQPELQKYRDGQDPGLDNPLGARALYIHQNGKDTLYRLHGSGQVSSIGKAVSSGCVRLLHQDVIHLYSAVRDGSPILVI